MTRDEAVKFAPIIKAYSEGKEIQFIGNDGDWHDFHNIDVIFCDNPDEYRIKPEAKYRPFENAQECWDEMQKHQPFGWLKNDNGFYIVDNIFNTDDEGDGIYVAKIYQSYKNVCCDYTFADGTPFGIKEGGEQ